MHRDWGVGVGSGSPSAVSYPAKWSLDVDAASCADDFVVYPTGAAGSGSQPSIVGYFNVYSGCTAPVPAVDFAYNTGGTITGATSFSVDGTQLAFIQTSAGVASLVLLKIEAPPGTGSFTTPITLTPVSRLGVHDLLRAVHDHLHVERQSQRFAFQSVGGLQLGYALRGRR